MLIYCTNCGKPISDQAKVCPHCNFVFADVVEKQSRQTVDYMTLPQDKKDGLLEEFSKDYPMHGMNVSSLTGSKKKSKVFMYASLPLLLVAVVLMMIPLVSNDKPLGNDPPPIIILALILAVAGLALSIVAIILQKKGGGNYQSLKSYKYFELWLDKRGYDNLQFSFENENLKYMYKNIEIDEEIK